MRNEKIDTHLESSTRYLIKFDNHKDEKTYHHPAMESVS